MKNETHRIVKREGERGSTLIEFALVATVALTMIFAVIDFSRAAYAYHFVSDAARQATRWASVHGNSSCSTYPSQCKINTPGPVWTYVGTLAPAGLYVCCPNCAVNCSSGPGYLQVSASWPGTAGSGIPTGNTSCNPSPNDNPGCAVQVTVQYTYGFMLPFMPHSNITMSSTSEMLISQ